MAIEKKTVTFFRVVCDGCADLGAESHSEDEARQLVQQKGWQHFRRFNGVVFVERDLCPSCTDEWEKEKD
jgi:hypothetical protein